MNDPHDSPAASGPRNTSPPAVRISPMTRRTTSAKQCAANQRNAQHSKGPTSDRGMAISKMNALKHGCRAQTTLLPGENDADFHQRLDHAVRDFRPRNDTELR